MNRLLLHVENRIGLYTGAIYAVSAGIVVTALLLAVRWIWS